MLHDHHKWQRNLHKDPAEMFSACFWTLLIRFQMYVKTVHISLTYKLCSSQRLNAFLLLHGINMAGTAYLDRSMGLKSFFVHLKTAVPEEYPTIPSSNWKYLARPWFSWALTAVLLACAKQQQYRNIAIRTSCWNWQILRNIAYLFWDVLDPPLVYILFSLDQARRNFQCNLPHQFDIRGTKTALLPFKLQSTLVYALGHTNLIVRRFLNAIGIAENVDHLQRHKLEILE